MIQLFQVIGRGGRIGMIAGFAGVLGAWVRLMLILVLHLHTVSRIGIRVELRREPNNHGAGDLKSGSVLNG